MSGLPPLPGDPAAVRLLAARLTSSSRRLGAITGALVRLRDGATWDGPAGDAFGRRLHEVTPVLDAVALRLGGAAAPLRRLADAMEEAQQVVSVAVRDDDDAEHAYAVLEDRAYALLSAGSGEEGPEVLLVRHLQREQAEVRALAAARHAAAAERFREADRRCAQALRSLSVDGLTDSLPYRAVAGASSVGHDLSSLGPFAAGVPWLRPVAVAGDVLGLAADGTLLVGYGEGDAGALAAGAALAATGGMAGVLRRGAVAGARRTSSGVVVTRRLTAQERLRLGAVAEVRQRRDDLRRRFAAVPERGTPSALLVGPSASGSRRRWPVGTGGAARPGVSGARAALDARVV
ncbi:MAG TPA: WXG100 family type VII secretion target, partial [Ornithinibacter sp.]|nr:WXG100 family type VII secretion target [Ornithinibacter sp.]